MSIVNGFAKPDAILIGVDTETMFPNGACAEASKLVFLPHLSAAVGFRGIAEVFSTAAGVVQLHSGTFDDLSEAMPEIIAYSMRATREQLVLCRKEVPDDIEYTDFMLTGFSQKAGRMVLHAFCTQPDRPVSVHRDITQFLAPIMSNEEISALNIVADRAGMQALALAQCHKIRGASDKFVAGGRFFMTEIRKGKMTTEEVFSFPPRHGPTRASCARPGGDQGSGSG